MCIRCAQKGGSFLPAGLLVPKQSQKMEQVVQQERLVHVLTLFGALIFEFVGGVKEGSALILLQLSRGLHVHCISTTGSARALWRQLVISSFSADHPLVFPPDCGPVTDDDISLVMPGVECPALDRWLEWYKICIAKLQWLQQCEASCDYVSRFLLSMSSSPIWLPMLFNPGAVSLTELTAGIPRGDKVFSRNEVRFITQSAPGGALPESYGEMEALERRHLHGAVSIPLDGGRMVMEEMRRVEEGGTTSLFRIMSVGDGEEPEDSVIYYPEMRQAVNRVLSDLAPVRRGQAAAAQGHSQSQPHGQGRGWTVRLMSPSYEMPLEVYLISRSAPAEPGDSSIEVKLPLPPHSFSPPPFLFFPVGVDDDKTPRLDQGASAPL